RSRDPGSQTLRTARDGILERHEAGERRCGGRYHHWVWHSAVSDGWDPVRRRVPLAEALRCHGADHCHQPGTETFQEKLCQAVQLDSTFLSSFWPSRPRSGGLFFTHYTRPALAPPSRRLYPL